MADVLVRVFMLSLFLFMVTNMDALLFDILNGKDAPDTRFGARPSGEHLRPGRDHIC
jgi:hypothetical protein